MAELHSCLAVVIVLVMPMVLSCSKRQAAPDNRQAAIDSLNRGNAYNGKGEYDKAIADCNEAIRLAPTIPEWYSFRAKAYRALAEEEKAAADDLL